MREVVGEFGLDVRAVVRVVDHHVHACDPTARPRILVGFGQSRRVWGVWTIEGVLKSHATRGSSTLGRSQIEVSGDETEIPRYSSRDTEMTAPALRNSVVPVRFGRSSVF